MSSKVNPQADNASKFDTSTIIRFILGYEDYWRLMIILFISGILAATCYFVFATATYESRSLIRVNNFLVGVDAAQGVRARENAVVQMRALSAQLNSSYLILEAAKKIGVASSTTSIKEVRETIIPLFRVNILDGRHLEVTVLSFRPDIVRDMPKAIVAVYEEVRLKMQEEYREEAIKRYAVEIEQIRKKVGEQLDSKLQYEEQSALASAQIELERLSNIPVEIVRTKYLLSQHSEVSSVLEQHGDTLDVIGKLSLIGGLVDNVKDPLEAGRVVRRQSTTTPFTFSSPGTDRTQLIVQPNMVEGLTPWQELEKTKRTLEEKLRFLSAKFLEDHPEVIQLKEELKEIEASLEIELKVALTTFELEKSRLEERLNDLESKLPDYHKATKNFDVKKQDYDLLQRSQLAWDKAYEKLSQRIETLGAENENSNLAMEFRGFTNLRDGIPVSPNKMKLLMMGCLLGVGLAGGLPFLLRRFDSSVVDLNEFEGSLGINGIGLVPMSDPNVLQELNRAPTIGANVPNALLENFRLIRSSILLNKGPKGDGRVIMLTSARPAEGKTTISSNVAWAFSSLGERTLLIDCDLRRGRIHDVVGASNAIGMTNLLTGRTTLNEAVQKTQADNLWAITRGPVLAGTTELLNSGVFAAILEQLKGQFDRIILDTPPVLGLSETAFLQNHADGIVIVVRSGVTMRKDVEDAVQTLQKLGGHFYGFVLNGVDFSKRLNHYYYYYYSSSYYDSNWDNEPAQPGDRRLK